MVYVLYKLEDKKIYFDGVYKSLEDAEDKKQLLNDPANDVKYDIVDLPYWTPQRKEVMHYSEEDNNFEEEDYYKLLNENKKLQTIVDKQKKVIIFMDEYINMIHYSGFAFFGITLSVTLFYALS